MAKTNRKADLSPGNGNLAKKMKSEDIEDVGESFTPREYQVEILESAKEHNTIACLGTGTGKTFIAVLLIREMAAHTRIPFVEGGKRIFFLVPTVPLVHQQAKVIENHTELTVGEYCGEMNVDTWDVHDWRQQFLEKHVLVMTGEICRIILDHSFLPVSRICLLIFDECHNACGSHPYAEIMRHISTCKQEDVPKIFSLTASLLNGKAKPSKVERKLQGLEATLLSKIVTASDYDEVTKYGTDPDEVVVLYNSKHESAIANKCTVALEELRKLAVKLKDVDIHSPTEDGEISFFTKPYRCVNQVCNLYEQLGPWCAACASKVFCVEIDKYLFRVKSQNEINILKEVKRVFLMCVNIFGEVRCDDMRELPNKLSRFIEILQAMNEWDLPINIESNLNPNLKQTNSPVCIVFVEQRIVAYVLCEWIKEIRAKISKFHFMKADFIVGHGSAGVTLEIKASQMSVKRQQNVLKRFREKEFNILIATSVLEEGMDIQKCNVVVRFDMPKDFRSYVQSKGRARAAKSKYVILVPIEKRCEFLEELCCFKTIEDFLLRKCNNRSLPDEELVLTYLLQHPLPPYQPLTAEGSPRVTLSSAISLVNRYCAKLPSDMSSKLTARWKVEPFDPENPEQSYVCTLHLPINSPLRIPIVGQPMKQKKLAKMAAALEACKLLHQIGELNDYLLPFKASVDVEAKELGVLEAEEAEDGLQPGTNKRKQLYRKEIADALKSNIPTLHTLCYLHVVVMDLVVPLAKSLNPRGRPIVNPADSPRGFALLTTKKLPQVPQFPIFTKVGKIRVSVYCVDKPFTIDANQLQMIEKFHQFSFSELLRHEEFQIEFSPSSSCFATFIVPVMKEPSTGYHLDWDFIKYTLEHEYISQRKKPKPSGSKFREDVFKHAVVSRSYKRQGHSKVHYFVTKIRYDMNPNCTFENHKFVNFKEFYKQKYKIQIKNDDQPLLEVEPCSSMNLINPCYTTVEQRHSQTDSSLNKQRHAGFREYLIPELCLVHPFSSALFRKASYLPSILYRLNHLLLAEQIRVSVASAENVGTVNLDQGFQWPVFNFEHSDEALRQQLINSSEIIEEEYPPLIGCNDISKSGDGEISSFQVKSNLGEMYGPSPSVLLIALTTNSAADEFDLERLETIGDSFLKYAVSIKIYASYPQKDEGCLTLLRSRLICNRNLYQLAKKKNLPNYLVNRPFLCTHSWIPPGYEAVEHAIVTNKKQDKKLITRVLKRIDSSGEEVEVSTLRSLQLISDKTIADSVEALIGAYLLSCGQEGALRFMSWIGVNPFVESDRNKALALREWPPVPRTPFIVDEVILRGCKEKMQLLEGFEQFEARINYKFKEPGYLLQAFTHASYYFNEITDCYQRLEFLGDAVLDYLITRKLFDDPKQHSPGKLTDLRAALVNNIYFASLAVKYGYHKNLKCLSVTLCKLVHRFIAKLTDSEAFKFFEKFGYYLEEIECFDLEEVEVPKALGDLFESVAGAIYLDSGMSLDAVWKVYYPMMKPAIDQLSESVPKSPVRELLEIVCDRNIITVEEKGEERCTVRVTLPDGKEFVGIGPNKRVAKRSAAKRAVHYLKFERTT